MPVSGTRGLSVHYTMLWLKHATKGFLLPDHRYADAELCHWLAAHANRLCSLLAVILIYDAHSIVSASKCCMLTATLVLGACGTSCKSCPCHVLLLLHGVFVLGCLTFPSATE
eukprot:GHUV01015208.1.p1 GENE.GHUV01015208.1~~GHUV01015208.1.p1  ORF type:complete len:113 (+),score=17.26 GHUV01015208.1:406-744(+)